MSLPGAVQRDAKKLVGSDEQEHYQILAELAEAEQSPRWES